MKEAELQHGFEFKTHIELNKINQRLKVLLEEISVRKRQKLVGAILNSCSDFVHNEVFRVCSMRIQTLDFL